MTKYRCQHCHDILDRDSEKAWMTSYCTTTGKNARLQKVITHQTAAHFERLHGERPDELSRLDTENEPDFDYEDGCPQCKNQGNYDECESCHNGSNFLEGRGE